MIGFSRGTSSYLFAESAEKDCVVELFDPAWLKQSGLLQNAALAGRGIICLFEHADKTLVLRHYRRGGFIRHLSPDRYRWQGLDSSRPWREFNLLAELQHLQLPAPVPYACCVSRTGWTYSGALITRMIPATETLAQKLCREEVPESEWFAIGQCIRRFHDAGVFHSDLNAHNILLNSDGRVFLIDFDKSGLRTGHGRPWKFANLKRLQRSIMKCWTEADLFFFSPQSWATLKAGYLSTD